MKLNVHLLVRLFWKPKLELEARLQKQLQWHTCLLLKSVWFVKLQGYFSSLYRFFKQNRRGMILGYFLSLYSLSNYFVTF